MCNMDKCNQKTNKNLDQLDKDVESVAAFVKELRELSGLPLTPMAFIEDGISSSSYVYFVKTNYCRRVTRKAMKNYRSAAERKDAQHVRFVALKKDVKLMIVSESTDKFVPQILITSMLSDSAEAVKSSLSRVYELLSSATGSTISTISAAGRTFSTFFTPEFKLFILDIFSFLFKLKDAIFTPYTILALLISLYTLHSRYMTLFRAQAGPDAFEVLFGSCAILGMPTYIVDHIKSFTALTGKRIFDADILLDTLHKILTSVIALIEWISEPKTGFRLIPVDVTKLIVSAVRSLGSSVFMHAQIKKVCSQYTKYVSNSSVLFDPAFRNECMNTFNECRQNNDFLSYIANVNNKYFNTTWTLYERNLIKSCRAFEASGRDEPICFVFEGAAGTGKSTVMNNLIDLLRNKGMTVYCHSVPSAMDGKDFYDDYENQDIFVMDDVGQQGVSQWRYIINYVSPVKYPLPCAAADKKNTKFFNSKYIFCTTNHFRSLTSFTSSDCISEPEALFRRCHVIDVSAERVDGDFIQYFKYFKYDYRHSHKWVNGFIDNCRVAVDYEVPINFASTTLKEFNGLITDDRNQMVLAKLYTMFLHVKSCHQKELSKCSVDGGVYRNIIDAIDAAVDIFEDANTEFEPQMGIFNYLVDIYSKVSFKDIYNEYLYYYGNLVINAISDLSQRAYNFVVECLVNRDISIGHLALGTIFGLCLLFFLQKYFFSSKEVEMVKFNNVTLDVTHLVWGPQNGLPERVANVRKLCKTLVVRPSEKGGETGITQCVVSGNRLLVPAHLDIDGRFVDLYQTYEHFENNHVEVENVKVKKLKVFLSCDLAVYEIMDSIPLYKLNKNLFIFGNCTNPNLYLVNSSGELPVLLGNNILPNNQAVTYATSIGKMSHGVGTGFYTPYSAEGGCGTVLASSDAGIIGFHVAGSNNTGFCVTPSDQIRQEIRELMLAAPCTDMELDTKVIPDFSGVRLRYTTPLDVQYVSGATSLIPTLLHVDHNEDMRELIEDVIHDPGLTPVAMQEIAIKVPPNFSSAGNPTKTLKKMSAKTFRRQGEIYPKEISFLKDYLRSLMVRFNDLPDKEVAFGGEYTKPLNKDSSNGYGCLKGKQNYFDFENKIIKEEALQLFEEFRLAAQKGDYSDFSKFVCRETFKDELRLPEKACKPRTFRVMPLGHIWWTKKVFGKLVKHFKENMHQTGIGVGFNPYKDFDVLAKKLLQCDITGDIDFGKWDGSILALLMMLIAEVFSEFYEGDHEYMIHYLFVTMSKSFVIVADELWATTHGLPSGTWLTLLVNCLLNKLLTALVIYRNKENATIEDVNSVVDYVMGDDKIIGASGEMAKVFNLHTINEVATSLGMECTNGDKTPIVSISHPFEKLTFVKRNFHKHPVLKKYVGSLSLETLMSTLMWMDSTKEIDTVLPGKMRSVLVESYLHSPALMKRYLNVFEKTYPFEAFFDERRIIRILSSDDGYEMIMKGLGKDFYY